MKKRAPKPSAAKAELYVKVDGVTSENNHYMTCFAQDVHLHITHTETAVVSMDIPI